MRTSGQAGIEDIEEALLFLAKTGIVSIEGGFMVLYNKIELERLNFDNRSRYKKEDYKNLDDFYRQRIQQIHIAGFESEGKHLYLSDFESYLRESQLETFIPGGESEIIVSTIHKAKGREFDNVYVSLKGLRVITDKERRAVYVAMTRAKKNLSVHYDNPALFDRNVLSAVNYAMDETDYGQPAEILIQMGHKDVVLNAFMNKRIDFASIHSGCVLNVGDDGLYLGFTRVVKFSGAFTKKLQALGSKGYIPSSAKVRVQVFWHHEDKEVTPPKWHHYMILLPDIWFTIHSN